MDVVELFAGIGGFRIAADRLGMRTVWANEIASKPCRVYRDRFGTGELVEGDLKELAGSVPAHEVLTAGFPCQPFSSAGKKRGVKDPRGTLFQSIVEIVDRRRPRVFVLENVKRLLSMEGGSHFATILAALGQLDYAIEWRLLNACRFGLPQNRQRVFLVGRRIEKNGRRKNEAAGAVSGEIEGVALASGEDLLASKAFADRERLLDPTQWTPIEEHGIRFPTWGLVREGRFFRANLTSFSEAQPPALLKSVLQRKVAEGFDFTDSTRARIASSEAVGRFVEGVEILSNQAGGARMGYTVFGTGGLAPTLTSTASRHYERYRVGDRYRRLTNVEYARIQGFPDEHCRAVSVYSQYALFGAAVPPPMAEWVLRRATSDQPAIVVPEEKADAISRRRSTRVRS